MFEALELGIGLEIVQWFQTIRFSLFDVLALVLHNLNSSIFYVVVIGAIYWMFDKKLGMRMIFALIAIGLITLLFKELLARPRPYQIIGSGIIPLVTESSYGIPSGHSSIALVMWGYVAIWMKNRALSIIIGIYILLMGLSRMYLGVHFPQDVIAGWLLGGVILWLYATQVERVVSWWRQQSIILQVGIPIILGLISIPYFIEKTDGLTLIGLLIGAGIAVTLEVRHINFVHKNQWMKRGAQFILGLVIAVLILEGSGIAFDTIEPPTYAYSETNDVALAELQAQVSVNADTPTAVCTLADQENIEAFEIACIEQVTPISAGLRILRYSLLALFALNVIPLLSIRLNLMDMQKVESRSEL